MEYEEYKANSQRYGQCLAAAISSAGRGRVAGHGRGARREDDGLDLAAAPAAGFGVGVVEEIQAPAAADVPAAVFDDAVAVARDIDEGAHGIVAGVGGDRAGVGALAAGGETDDLGLAAVAAGGDDRAAVLVEFPAAAEAAWAIGGGFDPHDSAVGQAVIGVEEKDGAPPQGQRGEQRNGQNDELAVHSGASMAKKAADDK